MIQYLKLAEQILSEGEFKVDRTTTGTVGLFGPQLEFDLRFGFPAVTTKKLQWLSVVKELQWMIRGSTNIRDLGVNIWNEWADENGDLGPTYGHQFRKWWDYRKLRPIDQINEALQMIKQSPNSRRIIVSAWNVADVPRMRLPPCHMLFQFHVGFVRDVPTYLDCKMYQRSADYFLGVPFNIAQYALLTSVYAKLTGLLARRLIVTFGDVHIYRNHIDQMKEQITRNVYQPPVLELPDFTTIEEFTCANPIKFLLYNYRHHPAIKGEVSV